MGFTATIKEQAMRACARHCCICHRYKGVKMELHHIKQRADGGEDSFENAIPVCYDCHSDIGHYNPRHPRGTKFTEEELKKSKENWYKRVEEGNIPTYEQVSDDVQTIYFVADSFDILAEVILEKDFKTFNKYKNNVLLFENEISEYWNELYKTSNFPTEQKLIIEIGNYKTLKDYELEKKNINFIDKGGNSNTYFVAERKIDYEELLQIEEINSFISLLIKSGVREEVFKVVLEEPRDTCEGGFFGYREYLIIPNISFIFLGVTNISDKAIKLKKIILKEGEYRVPAFSLRKNDMLFLPVATSINLRVNLENSITLSTICGDRGQTFIRNYEKNSRKQSEFIGNNLDVKSLLYITSDGEYESEIHEFDFTNFYSISKHWMCGCCPHLFFLDKNGKQIYSRELLKKASNRFDTDIFEVPEGIEKVIIRELEDETTFLEKLYINDRVVFSSVKLEKGEFLAFDVKSSDVIKIEGYYKPFLGYESNENGILLRNECIENSNYKFNIDII